MMNNILASQGSRKIFAMFRTCRPWAATSLAVAVALSYAHAGAESGNISQGLITVLTVLLIGLAAFPFNDVYDLAIDKSAHYERPLASGEMSQREALTQGWVMLLSGLGTASLLGSKAFVVSLLSALLVLTYSRIKAKWPLIANGVASLLFALAVAFPVFVIANPKGSQTIVVSAMMLGAVLLAREIVKDIEDLRVDVLFGRITLPIARGPTIAYRVAGTTLCVAAGVLVFVAISPEHASFRVPSAVMSVGCLLAGIRLWMSTEADARTRVAELKALMLMFLVVIGVTFLVYGGAG